MEEPLLLSHHKLHLKLESIVDVNAPVENSGSSGRMSPISEDGVPCVETLPLVPASDSAVSQPQRRKKKQKSEPVFTEDASGDAS